MLRVRQLLFGLIATRGGRRGGSRTPTRRRGTPARRRDGRARRERSPGGRTRSRSRSSRSARSGGAASSGSGFRTPPSMKPSCSAMHGDASAAGSAASRRAASRDDLDVELIDPEALRRAGRLVPVVDRLVVDERRLAAGPVDDEAVRVVDDRHPPLEVRVHFERIGGVVEELDAQVAGGDDERVEPAPRRAPGRCARGRCGCGPDRARRACGVSRVMAREDTTK